MSLQDAAIAANRFGLGARPGDLKAIAGDPRGWLKAQLVPETTLPRQMAALPTTLEDAQAFQVWIRQSGLERSVGAYRRTMTAAATPPPAMMAASPAAGPETSPFGATTGIKVGEPGFSVERSFVAYFGPRYVQALGARMDVAIETDRPFFERLVHFWGNHFTVSSAKPLVQAMPPSFERDVARRHAAGRFGEMLKASTEHPAMLLYLDNYISAGPNAFLIKNPMFMPARLKELIKGLNENLAREILELHTVGVRSGYTQDDVRTFAKIITGWTVKAEGGAGGETGLFNFVPAMHEPGPKTILNIEFRQEGLVQGLAALDMLAKHPATAKFIATKLVRHFVADDPPPATVARIAAVFRDSEGDLNSVCNALIDLPEAWAPQPAKFKPPEDYVVSAIRALGGPRLTGLQYTALFTRMGQRPYYAAGPNGWPDRADDWIGPDPVWKRLEYASTVGGGMASAGLNPMTVADAALGPTLSAATREAIAKAESPAQGLALFLVSPEFQRR